MRFMMLLKANADSEAGKMPTTELIVAMGKFNEELVKSGVLLAADGIQASSKGARVNFSGEKRTIVDGPFAETKELVSGYWIIQVKSLDEAIEWTKRCPNPAGSGEAQVEIRRLYDADDFAPVVADSAEGRAMLESEKEFRKRTNT